MTRVTIHPAPRKAQKNLVHAHEVGIGHPRIGDFFSGVRMPMYKANDSDDLHLMELISPLHELHRKLIEGNKRPMMQQHTPTYLQSPNESLDTTPKTKYKRMALKTLHTFPLSNKLNANLFGNDHVKPKFANGLNYDTYHCKQRKMSKDQSILNMEGQIQHQESLAMATRMHQNTLDLEGIKIYKSELSTHQNLDTNVEIATKFSAERLVEQKLGDDQRIYDLRVISKWWHQDCKSSISVQQRLRALLNSKYKEVFEDGRMFKSEKCKHNDFKAEVAQTLKNLERAGAPQLTTLNLKYELAMACVDEVIGEGMGEEYMCLERYFLQPCSRFRVPERDTSLLKEIARRVENKYADVQHIVGYMLDQLNPPLVT